MCKCNCHFQECRDAFGIREHSSCQECFKELIKEAVGLAFSEARGMITWKHSRGMYLSKMFRIFNEDGGWWLSDIRKSIKKAPSWKFRSAKEAKSFAAEILTIDILDKELAELIND